MTMQLMWDEHLKYGYYPVDPADWPYDATYFDKYVGLDATELGHKLTAFRADLVQRYAPERVIDIGIGGGGFINELIRRKIQVVGSDVNPKGIDWLKERQLYRTADIEIDAATFWDSFEHIPRPDKALSNVRRFAFISIPIFQDREQTLASKHFKPAEHYYYFHHKGLIGFMFSQGFRLLKFCATETKLGREDILSYVFQRMA